MVNPSRLVALAVIYLMRRLVFVRRQRIRACACDRERVQRVWGASRVASEGHHRGTMSVPLCMRHVSQKADGGTDLEKKRLFVRCSIARQCIRPAAVRGEGTFGWDGVAFAGCGCSLVTRCAKVASSASNASYARYASQQGPAVSFSGDFRYTGPGRFDPWPPIRGKLRAPRGPWRSTHTQCHGLSTT